MCHKRLKRNIAFLLLFISYLVFEHICILFLINRITIFPVCAVGAMLVVAVLICPREIRSIIKDKSNRIMGIYHFWGYALLALGVIDELLMIPLIHIFALEDYWDLMVVIRFSLSNLTYFASGVLILSSDRFRLGLNLILLFILFSSTYNVCIHMSWFGLFVLISVVASILDLVLVSAIFLFHYKSKSKAG